ncbi:MAG TPA: beta-glucosidase, partial [Firmicutes bacterium]|nr:beta-glucosidase [Bacillota bacterium]
MSEKIIGVPLPGFAEFSRGAAAEGMVLLKNENNTLPILKSDVLSVFGRCQFDFYRSGTGSGGAVNVEYVVNAINGLRHNKKITLNESLIGVYEAWLVDNPFDNGGGGWAAEPWFQKEMPLTDELVQTARNASNKAIYIIGRTAGEDKDNADIAGGYRLTEEEMANLQLITNHFEEVAVILNVSNVIDMSWVNDPTFNNHITAVLYAWQGGIEGGNALADILSGDITPSGKLTDTIAYRIEDYSSDKNFGDKVTNIYEEDIYLGYRYFETFNKEAVQYPFGYGLSYTTFNMNKTSSAVKGSGADAILELEICVTNTGDTYAGKEVVQVYYSAPQGVLGKPAKVLGAFAKTDVLEPGASQTLTISLPVANMASYDDGGATGHKSAYVLESGEYHILVGNSVRDLSTVHTYTVESLVVVEQLEESMAPVQAFNRMKPGALKEDGTYEVAYEATPLRTVDLQKRIDERLPSALEQTGNVGLTLKDVKEGRATLDQFIAQLSDAELAQIVRGEGMSSPKVTPGTAAAFGGVTDALLG